MLSSLSAPEVPIMDGPERSCSCWNRRGIVNSGGQRFIRIQKAVECAMATSSPDPRTTGFRLASRSSSITRPIPALAVAGRLAFSPPPVVARSAAPTGFMGTSEYMRERNLGWAARWTMPSCWTGHSGPERDGLRFADEFVRHKLLDAIGDLYLASHAHLGAYEGAKSGPRAEQQAGARPAATDGCLEQVRFDDQPRCRRWASGGLGPSPEPPGLKRCDRRHASVICNFKSINKITALPPLPSALGRFDGVFVPARIVYRSASSVRSDRGLRQWYGQARLAGGCRHRSRARGSRRSPVATVGWSS